MVLALSASKGKFRLINAYLIYGQFINSHTAAVLVLTSFVKTADQLCS
jgi:hypothetical protein